MGSGEEAHGRPGGPEDLQVVVERSGWFDERGGVLESVEHGVSLRIPFGALPGLEKREVYFKVFRENGVHLPPALSPSDPALNGLNGGGSASGGSAYSSGAATSSATLVSPLVMCGPHGLRFSRPVELRMPHRPDLRPDSWQFSLLHSSSESGQPGRWKETRVGGAQGGATAAAGLPGSGANPRVLDNGQISVLVDHF